MKQLRHFIKTDKYGKDHKYGENSLYPSRGEIVNACPRCGECDNKWNKKTQTCKQCSWNPSLNPNVKKQKQDNDYINMSSKERLEYKKQN